MKAQPKNLLNDYHLLSYDVLDSTNEEGKRLAGGGASHGAVIWAKRQTNGRGRMGREWISPAGNLYVSVLLSPGCELAQSSQISFVAAVAAVETLQPIIPGEGHITCKWPNDVLMDGKKIGGILLESFATQDDSGKERQWVVVGVGINIDSYPKETRYPAACLRDAGVEIISAKIVLSRFVYNFIQWYDTWQNVGFPPVHETWLKHAHQLGMPIEVQIGQETHSGLFHGVDKLGRLELELTDGTIKPFSAGDVSYVSR